MKGEGSVLKKIFLSILIVLLISSIVIAKVDLAGKKRTDLWDGHDWQKMNYEQKVYYISGLVAGINNILKQMSPENETPPYIKASSIEKMVERIDQEYKKGNLDLKIIELDVVE